MKYLSWRNNICWCHASVSFWFQVYISCSVMMCEMEADNTRCSQGCINSGRLGRHVRSEVVTQTSRHLVSQGPLRLKRSAEGAESPGNENRECFLSSTPAVFESGFTLCFSFLQWWTRTWTWTWSSSLDVFLQPSAWSVLWSCTKPKCQRSNTNLWTHLRAFQQHEQNTGSVLFTSEDLRLAFDLLAARQEVLYAAAARSGSAFTVGGLCLASQLLLLLCMTVWCQASTCMLSNHTCVKGHHYMSKSFTAQSKSVMILLFIASLKQHILSVPLYPTHTNTHLNLNLWPKTELFPSKRQVS